MVLTCSVCDTPENVHRTENGIGACEKHDVKENMYKAICPHCKGLARIRNPTGFCDHLYRPGGCKICSEYSDYAKQHNKNDCLAYCTEETQADFDKWLKIKETPEFKKMKAKIEALEEEIRKIRMEMG